MNLAELTDLELAEMVAGMLEQRAPTGERRLALEHEGDFECPACGVEILEAGAGPLVTTDGALALEALFRELRQAQYAEWAFKHL